MIKDLSYYITVLKNEKMIVPSLGVWDKQFCLVDLDLAINIFTKKHFFVDV